MDTERLLPEPGQTRTTRSHKTGTENGSIRVPETDAWQLEDLDAWEPTFGALGDKARDAPSYSPSNRCLSNASKEAY